MKRLNYAIIAVLVIAEAVIGGVGIIWSVK